MSKLKFVSENVICGEYVLHMRDTHGIPLDIMCTILDDRGWGFDVMGFIRACHANPNYSMPKCLSLLKSTTSDKDTKRLFDLSIQKYLDDLGGRTKADSG